MSKPATHEDHDDPIIEVQIEITGAGISTHFAMRVSEEEYVGLQRAAERSQAIAHNGVLAGSSSIPTLEVTR